MKRIVNNTANDDFDNDNYDNTFIMIITFIILIIT